jgi:hypothetical protein
MSNTNWLFPKNTPGRWEGINDGDAEHFLKNPIGSLAREIIQNSLDARVNSDPVIVSFDLFSINASEFPNLDQLKEKLIKASNTPKNQTDNRTRKRLEEAVAILDKPTLSILRISESNTTGMAGPADDDETPFYAYTKGSGLTGKTDGLGSFGIGKKAPVVNSALRTTFVSTVYNNPKYGNQGLAQGMSFWVTHKEGDLKYDGLGYWGVREAFPVTEQSDLPNWLRREHLGTNIYIIEPILPKDWQEILVGAVLTNFFAAIHDGSLEVKAGTHTISRDSIRDMFQNKDVRVALQSLDDDQYLESLNNSERFFEAYSDPKSILEQTQMSPPLGNFEIKLLVADDLPKQVGFLRNGMFITSNDIPSLRKFQNTKDFVAVVYCTNNEGNSVLREMEPPQHNAFEGNRYDRDKGPRLLKNLGKKIRDQLAKHIQPDLADVSSVDFLSDLFGYEGQNSTNTSGPTDLNPDGKIVQKLKAVSVPKIRIKPGETKGLGEDGGEDDSGEDESETPGGGKKGKGKKPGEDGDNPGPGGEGPAEHGIERQLSDPRVVYLPDGSLQTYFSVDHTGEVLLKFFISGAETDEYVNVLTNSVGSRFNGGIRLKANGPQDRIAVKVRLENVNKEAILISAYEI